jgi:hypothetical protein
MNLRPFAFSGVAAVLLATLGFGATPAAACGYNGCYAPAPVAVVVQPVQYYYQSCSCCGCGSSYYGSYYPAYTYPTYGYGYGYAEGYGPNYAAGYGFTGYEDPAYLGPVVAPRVYGYRRYVGWRRPFARY